MQLVDEEQMAGYHKSQLGRIEHRFRASASTDSKQAISSGQGCAS